MFGEEEAQVALRVLLTRSRIGADNFDKICKCHRRTQLSWMLSCAPDTLKVQRHQGVRASRLHQALFELPCLFTGSDFHPLLRSHEVTTGAAM
jgi:hypothetical protein